MKQTRANRKKAKNASKTPNTTEPNEPKKSGKSSPEKIYYSIIAVLLVVLVGIMVFIFMNRDTGVDLNADNGSAESDILTDLDEEDDADDETNSEDETVDTEEEEDSETEEEPEEEPTADSEEDIDEEEEEDQPEEEANTEDETDTEEEPETGDFEVTENAPLDESYTVNYGDGSGDRVAIANAVSSVTGLNQSDMITWRVGNDGPGRVFAVTSDSGRNNVYRVLLQYGDGQWHVTSVEELADVPAEFR